MVDSKPFHELKDCRAAPKPRSVTMQCIKILKDLMNDTHNIRSSKSLALLTFPDCDGQQTSSRYEADKP